MLAIGIHDHAILSLECCLTGDDYQYDTVTVGCVAPAPTPALVTSAPLGKVSF